VHLPVLGAAHFIEHLGGSGGHPARWQRALQPWRDGAAAGGYRWSCCLRRHCIDLQPWKLLSEVRSDVRRCTTRRGSSTRTLPFMRLAAPTHGLLHCTWAHGSSATHVEVEGDGRGEEGEGRKRGRWLAAGPRRPTAAHPRDQARWGTMQRPWQGEGSRGRRIERGQWAVRQADGGWCCRQSEAQGRRVDEGRRAAAAQRTSGSVGIRERRGYVD
jgi:hypothetical protein